jgi:hypothetical protein
MQNIDSSRLLRQLKNVVGPTPWYWETFPVFKSAAGQRFIWTYHGESGALGYVVSLGLEQEPDRPRIALNTYCRPFLVPPDRIGIWCPEGPNLRLTCFNPDQLKAFDFGEIAGWFKQSADRIYAVTPPIAELEVPISLPAGMNKIEVPAELQTVEELIVPTDYPANSPEGAAMALYVFYFHAGLVEVLPQRWFTAGKRDGYEWITRAARDPESHRIYGDGIRIGSFLLRDDGMQLEGWLDNSS